MAVSQLSLKNMNEYPKLPSIHAIWRDCVEMFGWASRTNSLVVHFSMVVILFHTYAYTTMLRCRERALGSTARISHAHQTTQVLRMVYKKVFVAGGARGVGRALIDKLVAQGSEVVALVRREDAKEELDAINGRLRLHCSSSESIITLTAYRCNRFPPSHSTLPPHRRLKSLQNVAVVTGVTAEVCDALDLKGVESVLDGCDAAISTLGGTPDGDEEKRVDYTGNRNVIESAGILGITRLVLVSSVGCGSSREAISDTVYQVNQSGRFVCLTYLGI